jgi:hypothetical protein
MHRFAVLLLCLVPSALAQANASLTGLVKDPSDAVLAAVKVTARHKATNVERSAATDASGYYLFPSLPVGEYTIAAEHPGFQRATRDIVLETAQKGRQDFTMAVGSLETTVTVEATAPQLSSSDASLGSVVDNTYVSQYPLLLRSWDDLMSLVAGVQGNRYTDQGGGTSFGRTGGFNVHGVRSLQNNFILDGVDNNSISENVQELSAQAVRPSVDTIQEFKIITNPYAAEYGRAPGAAIVVTTKGGTNSFHGLVYEYLRNRKLDANDFFSNRNRLSKPQNVQNQFGGNFGGPIVRDKLFFFFDYEGTRIRRGASRIASVPLPNERIGDFSAEAGRRIGYTYPTVYDPLVGLPFANNTIPANRIDPVAARLIGLFPDPTNPNARLNNFARNASLMDDTDRFNVRGDWQPSASDTVFARFTWSPRERFIPGNFGGIADGTSSSSQGRQDMKSYGLSLGWTRPLTPRVVNEFRAGMTRNNSSAEQDPFGANITADYVPGVPVNPLTDGGVPRTTFSDVNTFIGSPDFLPKYQKTLQYQWTDTVSLVTGRHQLKFGADLRFPLRNNYLDVPATRGQLGFDRTYTCQRNPAGQCAGNTGIAYADFLLGYVRQAALTNVYTVDQRLHMYSFFVQDDFKLTPRLTLNLGLRYDFASPPYEGRNRMANFDPSGAGALTFANDGSLSDRALVNPDRNNLAPRIGLAHQLNEKTVLRTGYGVFYSLFDRIGSEDQLALNPPNLINNNIQLPATATQPLFLLRSGFPADFLDASALDLRRVRIRTANPNAPNAYIQQWSFGIQRTFPLDLFIDVNYVGTKSTHLNTLRNLNQPINGVLPYPNFGQIQYRDPLGNAIYHGLDFTLERRFASGLTFRTAYTWSKSIDNTAEHLAASASNSFNQNGRDFSSWRGVSDFHVPHRFVASYVWELPFGKGRAFAQAGLLAWIIGGFRTSGGLTFASGRPYTAFANINNGSIDSGLHQALPNVVGTPLVLENVDCWVYSSRTPACRALAPDAPDAFAIPPAGQFGNAGRNILRAPGTKVFDFALHRSFAITEQTGIDFRWEVFNLTNTPQFGLPDKNYSGGSGGVITSLAGDARIMQFALRLKF